MQLLTRSKRSVQLATTLPLYDFLVPNIHSMRPVPARHLPIGARYYASVENNGHNDSGTSSRQSKSDAGTTHGPKPLTKAQRDFLSSALRVNQAGELAATLIYKAQKPLVVRAHPHLRPLMKHMYDQELGHFNTFNELIARHRVRPTAMYPLWTVAASALGWGTAVMGREAAMACTEAVETEIGSHYNEQVRVLLDMAEQIEKEGSEVGPEIKTLIDTIRRIRDEELEHLDHAVENDAKQAVPHDLLTSVIRAGCRGAIWISERV
ncbi:catabolite repression protein CAT5 [Xylogone sp. PMI_703]|nr:catabolite repression protein CAT5 [Xylogone sp. PMI_703]